MLPIVRRFLVGWALLAATAPFGLAGCEWAPPATSPATSPAPGASEAPEPQIANLKFDSRRLVGDEAWTADMDIVAPGSGTIARYGLSHAYGSKLYDVKPPLPVVAHGHIQLNVGPMPHVPVGGDIDVTLWLVDDAGHESNRLVLPMGIQ